MLLKFNKYSITSGSLFFSFTFILLMSFLIIQAQSGHSEFYKDSFFFIENNKRHYYDIILPGQPGEINNALIFIDPGGNPGIPLLKYESLLLKNSFLGICSREIKNGPLDKNLALMGSLVNHIKKKYSIAEDRIILAGFSGGSRMAAAFAAKNSSINKVIACGSGFAPGYEIISSTIPNYIGIAGTQDMNLTEMISNYLKIEKSSNQPYLMIYPGTHSWPELRYFENALIIIENGDSMATQEVIKEELSKIDTFIDKGMIMEAYFSCRSLRSWENGQYLFISPDCESKISRELALNQLEEEQKEIYIYSNAFDRIRASSRGFKVDTQPRGWWKKQVMEINMNIEKSQSISIINMNKRILGFISANAYENAMILINFEKQYEFATEFLEIWSLTAPDSPFPFYSLALNYARIGNKKKTEENLKIAIGKGIEEFYNPSLDPLLKSYFHRSK